MVRNWALYSLRGLHIRIVWFSLYGIRYSLVSIYGVRIPLCSLCSNAAQTCERKGNFIWTPLSYSMEQRWCKVLKLRSNLGLQFYLHTNLVAKIFTIYDFVPD